MICSSPSKLLALIALLNVDPFNEIRQSLAKLLVAVLGLVAMISLVVTVINIIQGDREAAKKAGVWLVATLMGFMLITIIGF